MADDPLGLAESTELFTAPLMVVTMLPPGPEGREAAQVIADALDYLVDPDAGWYQALSDVSQRVSLLRCLNCPGISSVWRRACAEG